MKCADNKVCGSPVKINLFHIYYNIQITDLDDDFTAVTETIKQRLINTWLSLLSETEGTSEASDVFTH